MDEFNYENELEHRLIIFEDPESTEGALAPLPNIDIVVATLLVLVPSVLLLWWGYF